MSANLPLDYNRVYTAKKLYGAQHAFTCLVLNPYVPILFEAKPHAYDSKIGDYYEIHGAAGYCFDKNALLSNAIYNEFVELYVKIRNEMNLNNVNFHDIVGEAQKGDTRAAWEKAEELVEKLRSIGTPQQYVLAITSLFEKLITRAKHGHNRDIIDIEKQILGTIINALDEYMHHRLAERYMVLSIGLVRFTLLNPPTTGLYVLPGDFLGMLRELARLFPSDVVVREDVAGDIHASFYYVFKKLKGNKTYVAELLTHYMNQFGTSLNNLGESMRRDIAAKPYLAPILVKTAEAGHLVLMGLYNDQVVIAEFPRIKDKEDIDFIRNTLGVIDMNEVT